MSDRLTGMFFITDICHPPICQWPLLAIFSSLLIARGSRCHLASFFSGIRGAQGPKDVPASPDEETAARIQNRHTRESREWHVHKCHKKDGVEDDQTRSFPALNGDNEDEIVNFQLRLSVCFGGACGQPWSDKWFHPAAALYSDKGQRTQRRGCQGNMVIEGKRQMCAYTLTHVRTHSLLVNDSFARLEDIQSVEDPGSVTLLSLEVMVRTTCRDTDSGGETWRKEDRHTKTLNITAYVRRVTATNAVCTRAARARSPNQRALFCSVLLKWDTYS